MEIAATRMDQFKAYLFKNFEQGFVLLLLVSVAFINYFIPYKLAFLNFYFIPILLAAYHLDVRRALLGAFLCIILVGVYFWNAPESFACGGTPMDLAMNIIAWGSFLILTGAIVGKLCTRLRDEVTQSRALHAELVRSHAQLETAGKELRAYSSDLEHKVNERTGTIEESKRTIEALKNKVEETLFSTMDAEVAKLIIEGRLRNEKRKISIMFCDLVGFTAYSEEHQPEVVIGDLNHFLGEMEGLLESYRGHIDKYTGDGMMVEFGAPINYDRHALLSVIAGLKMQERFSKIKFPWKMRLGISTGEPIVGLLGTKRQMYTAIGDAVNLASRIEGVSTPGRVTIDERTFHEVQGFVETSRKTLLPVGTFAGPDDVKTLTGYLEMLDANPSDAGLLKKVGFLLAQGENIADAREYFKRALELEPDDDRVKLAYADTSIKLENMGNIAVKGHKRLLRLYEAIAIKDPLKDPAKISPRLYEEYSERVRAAVPYPEDLILPVECLDGSIGLSKLVGFFAYVIADVLGLPDQEKKDVLLAGYLADIGKTIVPHHLLNRAGSLEKIEFDEVKKHSREAVRVLKKMGYQTPAVFDIIASHHENFCGGGYPEGVAGDKIPLGGRIVAVADEYASYVSWRPYRNRWDSRAAFAQIETSTRKGKFDPKVVEALSSVLNLASV